MGVIKITPRSSSLQSGHSAGAGSVHIPNMPTNIDTGEVQKWRGVGNFGQGVADFGEKMLKTVGVFAEIKNETQLDEFESDFLSRIHEANMNPETGFMTRRIGSTADVEALEKDAPQAYKDIFNEVAKAHGMTGVKKNWAMNRVGRMIESANYRLASRVSAAYQQLNLSQAAANAEARHTVWNDGMDDQAATEELLDAKRKLLYAQGLDDNAVELKFGEQVENLAEEYATRRFSELPDEAAVDAELKKIEENPAGVLAGNKALSNQFSTKHPFSQNVADRLKGRLEARRREIRLRDQQIVDQAANVGIAAVAQIRDKDGNYPPGRLATVEASIESLQRIQSTLPKESDAATRAAAHISELDSKADMIAASEWMDRLMNKECVSKDENTGAVTVSKPIGMVKGSRDDRAFDAAKAKYMKAVEESENDLKKARDKIWDGNKENLQRKLINYYQSAYAHGDEGKKMAREAYDDMMDTWSEMSGGSLSPEFTLQFQRTVKDIDKKEIADGMAKFWRMLKDVKIESKTKFISGHVIVTAVPKLGNDGSISAESIKGMEADARVGYDTGDADNPFTMTVSEAIAFSEQVRNELNLLDLSEIRKSEAVEAVVKRVYVDVAKRLAEGKISRSEVGAELARDWGERMTETKMLLGRTKATTLVEAVETERQQAEWRKQYTPQK